jgi:hypothetical protein
MFFVLQIMDFNFNFGGIDLNNPAEDDEPIPPGAESEATFEDTQAGNGHKPTDEPTHEPGFMSVDDTTDTGAPTGHTISTEDSGSDGEVQSTPEDLTQQKPYVGMRFDSWEATQIHYNRYAKHLGFSMKLSSSRQSVMDNEKDKYLFVCNKSGKNSEKEGDAQPVKQRN